MRPTKAPINKQAIIATNALCSNITNIYADIISEEVATDPIERSNPSTTSVHVTPNANIPVIATDWKINTAERAPAKPLAKMEKNNTKPANKTRNPYLIENSLYMFFL